MRCLCKEYRAFPQASTRAFTSKFKAGTLPIQSYQSVENNEKDLDSPTSEESDKDVVEDNNYPDEDPEYDSDSLSEDQIEEGYDTNVEAGFQNINQNIVTRSGRTVAASRRFMHD